VLLSPSASVVGTRLLSRSLSGVRAMLLSLSASVVGAMPLSLSASVVRAAMPPPPSAGDTPALPGPHAAAIAARVPIAAMRYILMTIGPTGRRTTNGARKLSQSFRNRCTGQNGSASHLSARRWRALSPPLLRSFFGYFTLRLRP
jgi:hypothetical protein